MKIAVIADPDTVLAFRLAGIEARVAHSVSEVTALIAQLRREEIGLMLITEALAEGNRDVVEAILLEPGGPLILEIPEFKGPLPDKARATDRIAALLRR
jgi:V/A-type H+/Na+-transporting ATPase subunit F